MIGETAQLAVELKLKDQQFQSSIAKDEAGLRKLNTTVGKTGGAFSTASKHIGSFGSNVNNAFSNVGRGAGNAIKNVERLAFVAGTVAVGGIVAATKAAINFEDAFAGIRKTVNENDLKAVGLSFDSLSDSIRKMAREIPVSAVELSKIGEAAGALGVRATDIEQFTKVVAELAVTTDLSSDQAATALGQLGTTLHLTGNDFTEFADTLVALGNAGASTESQIVEMAARFAAAGTSAGLTKEQVLALSSAVASMGIDVEAGGTALSQTFNNIATGIGTGSAQAKQFATTLGLSAAQFKEAWRRDALGTFEDFLQELNKLDQFEQANVLDKVGITGARQLSAVKLMAQNVGFVNAQLKIAGTATGALGVEAAKKFATTASQIQILKNNLTDVGITVGTELLPKITALTTRFATFLNTPAAQGEIKRFAKDLAAGFESLVKWVEKIDFRQIGDSLKVAATFGKGLIQAFLSAPQWLQTAVVTGWGLNKLTGGAVQNIMADLTKAVIGGALQQFVQRGASPANPLYVSDIAGGLGGATGAAGAAGKGLGLVSKVFLVGEAIGLAVLVNDVRQGIADASTKQSQALQGQLSEFLGKQPDQAGIENALKGVKQGIVDLESSNLPLFLVQGDALDNLKKMRVELEQQLAEAKGARLTGNLGRPGPMLLTIAGKLTALQAQLHADLLSAIGVLKTSSDPAAIAAAVAKAEAAIKGGAGSAGTTKGVLADLKAQLKTAESTGNKDLAGKIRAAIKDIEPFAKGRQWQQAQIAEARKIVASNKTTAQKVAALKSIEDGLLAHQRTMAAQIVGGLMDVVSAVKGIPGQSPTINQYTGFTVPGGTPKPGPRKPTVLSGDSPGQGHAAGFLGLTTGTSDLGIAGEAGREAVAIVKNPKAIKAGIARVFVTNWPDGNGGTSQRVDTPTITKAKQDADQLKEAIKAIKARAIAAGHRGTDEKNRKTLASDIKRGISMDDILHRKPMVIHAKVTSSIKDTADAIIVRGRWGKTAAQAGGA